MDLEQTRQDDVHEESSLEVLDDGLSTRKGSCTTLHQTLW